MFDAIAVVANLGIHKGISKIKRVLFTLSCSAGGEITIC